MASEVLPMVYSRFKGYGMAVFAVMFAAGIQPLLQNWAGPPLPLLAFLPAVLVSATWGGYGPGLLSILLSALLIVQFQLGGGLDRLSLLLLVPVAGSVVWLVVRLRDANRFARSVRQELELLADAGVALSSTLDSQTTLANLAALVVPRLADWSAIDVLDGNGELRRVAVVHRDPAMVEMGHLVSQRYPVDPEAQQGRYRVVRQGQTEWTARITDEMLVKSARSAEHLEMMRKLALKSYLCVPLKTANQILGTLTVCYAESARVYKPADVALAEDLGRRAGVAIENARLREEAEHLLEAERAARSEAERAGRLKDEFLATLSHELRTPLNAMLGWSHILRSGGLKAAEVEQGLEILDRNAHALARIVEDLLDMSKIMQGKIHLDVQEIDLVKVVDAAVQAVQPSCSPKKIAINCLLPATAPTRGDGFRLQQVFWNLLSNAIKFSSPGGRIDLKLEVEDEQFVLSVQDYGSGITPEFLPHLFEKFRQQDGRTTRGVGGMGLGLSIARQILEFHGGSVRAYSQGKNAGSLFVVELPRLGSREAEPATPQAPVKLDEVRILVVEDDDDTRLFLVRLLKDRGANVVSAASADQALALLSEHHPDLLISDIGMPDKDGYQLIREIRAQPGWEGLPAIAVTAFARREDKEAALSAGYQRHVSKPVNPARLLQAAESLTGKVRAKLKVQP